MQGQIRWKKQDYLNLGKAVASFNRKINQVSNILNEDYLPEIQNYYNLKENIKTRADLKRTINSLRRFGKEGAEELYVTEAGQMMTVWERRELRNIFKSSTKQAKKRTKRT